MMPDFTRLMAFENGELNNEETVELFSELVKSGMAWQLQGFYGRTAKSMIEQGYLDGEGNILSYGE
jgi:hypothetical protein